MKIISKTSHRQITNAIYVYSSCHQRVQPNVYFLLAVCKFTDFEEGLDGWIKTGTAFDNQPTFGDNPTARGKGQPANQQGNWWIGGHEDRPSKESPAGATQGDAPQGTLTSPYFTITGGQITFLIGGGCAVNAARAELIIGNQVRVQTSTNTNRKLESDSRPFL